MAQQLLDGANVGSRLEQVCCKTVPQGMHRNRLEDSSSFDRVFDSPLQSFFIGMVPSLNAAAGISRKCWRWKHPEPPPGVSDLGILLLKCKGRLNATALRLPIRLPLSTCSQHLSTQGGCQRPWQHDDPVFAALGLTHDDDG